MFLFLVWTSNGMLGLGAGLYFYRYFLYKKLKKEKCIVTEALSRKLKLCSFGKWGILYFVVIKLLLCIYLALGA